MKQWPEQISLPHPTCRFPEFLLLDGCHTLHQGWAFAAACQRERDRERLRERDRHTHIWEQNTGFCFRFSAWIVVVLPNEYVQEAVVYMRQAMLSKEFLVFKLQLTLLEIFWKILYYYCIQQRNIMQTEIMTLRNNT